MIREFYLYFILLEYSAWPRVGNRPSITRHRPNRRPRFFDVVSSRLGHRGRENKNRPSEICSKNSRPISSPRCKTDETNRFRVVQITVTGIATIMQWNAIFLWQSYGVGIIYSSHKVSASWDVTGRPPLRCLLSTFPVTNRLYRPSRPAYDFVLNFWKDDLNRLVSSWNLQTDDIKSSVQKAPQKTSSVRPETLDDRRDGTMPTLLASQHHFQISISWCWNYCSIQKTLPQKTNPMRSWSTWCRQKSLQSQSIAGNALD